MYFKFYSRFWEYSSLEDLAQILKAVTSGSLLILFATFLYNRAGFIPRSIVVLDLVFLMALMCGARILGRIRREGLLRKSKSSDPDVVRVLILGAGHVGAQLLKHLRSGSSAKYHVVGFIDDDPMKLDCNLMGVKVLGDRFKVSDLVREHDVQELLIASAQITSKDLNAVIDICVASGVNYKLVASVFDLSTKEIHVSKLKSVEVGDLLGREVVSLDLSLIQKMIQGKRILVTGAGGSIGSELCSQILTYNPASLVMVDFGENYLYELETALSSYSSQSDMHYVFCSVAKREKMEECFREFRPQLVFHAAAHKHVHVMEKNVDEAIINNVFGTKIIAEISECFDVETFVLVSTDKVVNPVSVMGMTKKIAEDYVHSISSSSKTKFTIVRFGNVLGSRGSVVPVFEKQIREGGPVCVTHPDMTRYFMLIPEAVYLILQAAAIGKGGEKFLLDMGEPVKVVDLARKMIELAGFVPEKDIKISYIGVRRGEKLEEELVSAGEKAFPTFHSKIKVLRSERKFPEEFEGRVDELCELAKSCNQDELRMKLEGLAKETDLIFTRC
ncbi:MAG: polysaccharide biosynthesis protein [Nitrospina sp.]|nr:polysaccharide biosynthesis protein [Nitrospina sp.]